MYFYNKISGYSVSPTTRTVYRVLLQYANRETWSCFPSVKTLANDTGLSERTIRTHLNKLVKEELILKIPRKRQDNGNSSNLYFFN